MNKDDSNLLMLLLVFMAGTGIYLFMEPSPKEPVASSAASVEEPVAETKVDKILNYHLKDSHNRQKMLEAQKQMANEAFAPELKPGSANRNPVSLQPIDTSVKNKAIEAFNEIQDLLPNEGDENFLTPDERIGQIMKRQQITDDYDATTRQEFIKAFRDNARASGYEVILDEDLNVTKVKRLRKKTLRIPNSVKPGGGH